MGVCGDVVGTPLQARMVSALVLHVDDLAVGDELQGIYRIGECGPATSPTSTSWRRRCRRAADDPFASTTRPQRRIRHPPRCRPSSIASAADPSTRAAVDVADIIVLAVGSGDVTPPPPSTRCPARRRSRCPEVTVSQFRDNLTAWIDETDHTRQQGSLVLRVITPPPTSGSPSQNDVARTACQIAAAHRAACINTYSLARTDEHITTVKTDPRHPQLTQHGHDLVATQLIATGLL